VGPLIVPWAQWTHGAQGDHGVHRAQRTEAQGRPAGGGGRKHRNIHRSSHMGQDPTRKSCMKHDRRNLHTDTPTPLYQKLVYPRCIQTRPRAVLEAPGSENSWFSCCLRLSVISMGPGGPAWNLAVICCTLFSAWKTKTYSLPLSVRRRLAWTIAPVPTSVRTDAYNASECDIYPKGWFMVPKKGTNKLESHVIRWCFRFCLSLFLSNLSPNSENERERERERERKKH